MKNLLAVLLLVLLGSVPAWAVLGEQVATVASDQKSLRGEVRSTTMRDYSVQQITAADRSVINEYVSLDGLVFGISWRAPVMPNLQLLLGSYYPQLQQAAQSQVRRRGPLVLRTDRFVVESGGHLRSFHGRAYIPSLLPEGVSEEVVR